MENPKNPLECGALQEKIKIEERFSDYFKKMVVWHREQKQLMSEGKINQEELRERLKKASPAMKLEMERAIEKLGRTTVARITSAVIENLAKEEII